jgi:hypothetical protein
MDMSAVREYLTGAIRFWEHKRVVYNLVWVMVVLVCVTGSPASNRSLTHETGRSVLLLAVLANVAYCAAYGADVFVQMSVFRERWRAERDPLGYRSGFRRHHHRFWGMAIFEAGNRQPISGQKSIFTAGARLSKLAATGDCSPFTVVVGSFVR